MKHQTRLLDILDRAENGPVTDEMQWDMFFVPKTIRDLCAEFDIRFDRYGNDLVSSDDALADRLFEAGLAMAERIGVFCTSTARQMRWTKTEIERALRAAPEEITIGEGLDQCVERKRNIGDRIPVLIKGGGVGTVVPEPLYIPIHQAYAQEPLLDAMINCTLETVYGREIRSRSPWEILSGWYEARTVREACVRAGRPGLGLGCVQNAVSEISELSADGERGFGHYDWHHITMVSEFKTDYSALNKLSHLISAGHLIHSFYNTVYGGSVGGREGLAVAVVGGTILLQMVYMTCTHSVSPVHPFYGNDTCAEIMLPLSAAQQALARNTGLLTEIAVTPVGGPMTRTLLYETAALSILATVSGSAGLLGPRSAAGAVPGHISPLEARFMAETAHAAEGMLRTEANRIVRELYERYRGDLDKRPIGMSFEDVYDLRTLQPNAEWEAVYEEVSSELRTMGLTL